MKTNIPLHRRWPLVAAFAFSSVVPLARADVPLSKGVATPANDGWQALSASVPAQPLAAAPVASSAPAAAMGIAPGVVLPDAMPPKASLSPGESVVSPEPVHPGAAPLAFPSPYAKPSGTAALQASGAAVVPAATPAFVLHQGDHIRAALDAWLKPQGWHLDWSAGGGTPGRLRDLVADEDYTLHPTSVGDLLQTLLAGYGFAADVDSSPLIRRIVVRNDSNVTE